MATTRPERDALDRAPAPAARTDLERTGGAAAPPVQGRAVTAADALRLQRLAGNRAVTTWRQQARTLPDGTNGTGGPRVGPAPRVPASVQRRRVPDTADTNPLIDPAATDRDAHLSGLGAVVRRAQQSLTAAQWSAVRAHVVTAVGGRVRYWLLSDTERQRRLAARLRVAHPHLVFGDPALIDTGARAGTADAVNIANLVTASSAIIGVMTSGAADADLTAVFGAGSVAGAKAAYTNANTAMQALHTSGDIVTDRSGYNAEVGLGGLTSPAQISVSPGVIDNPADHESLITMIHEAMHAGNPAVDDRGYLGSPGFLTMTAADKLANAAHFEVPVRRHLGTSGAYTGQVFVPAGTTVTVGGVAHTAPTLTPVEQAGRDTSELFRNAWTMGLNMHSLWVRIHLARADWTGTHLPTAYGGATATRFRDCMPYWSKVQGMTVHDRPGISASGGAPSTAPVTAVDVALSEGVVRLLGKGMDVAARELADQTTTEAFLGRHSNVIQRYLATSAAAIGALLVKGVLQEVGDITGSTARDVRVVQAMAAAGLPADFSGMLAPRAPASFT